METISIRDVLETNTFGGDGVTFYSSRSPETKRQLAVTAVLELIQAEALGGGASDNGSVIHNLNNLDSMVDQVMEALEPNNK